MVAILRPNLWPDARILASGQGLINFYLAGGVEGDPSASAKAKNDAVMVECIDQVKDLGGGTVYLPAGTWNFSSQISIQNSDGVCIRGAAKNCTILQGFATGQNGIYCKYAKSTHLSDFTIKGVTSANPPSTENHGIQFDGGCDWSSVKRVRAENNDDANIRIGYHNGEASLITSPFVVVEECEAIGSPYGSGIEVIYNEDCVITRNYSEGNANHGVRVSGTNRTKVSQNKIVGSASHGVSVQGGLDAFAVWHRPTDVTVTDNILIDNVTGICLFNQVDRTVIANNQISLTEAQVNYYGILFNSGTSICAENVIVTGNHINGYSRNIYLNPSSNILRNIEITKNQILEFASSAAGTCAGIYHNGNANHKNILISENLIRSASTPGGGINVYGIVTTSAGSEIYFLHNRIYLDSPTNAFLNTSSANTNMPNTEPDTNIVAAYT